MATETLEVKTPEAESLPKEEESVADSDKETEKKVSNDAEKNEVEKGEKDAAKDLKEKGETYAESEEENTGKSSKSSEKEPVTPVSDRPTRERKKTERYILPTPSRSSANKPVSIQQGRGTRLKEIPNVAYKLSKRKPDDNLFLLHTILYGKKGKAHMLKRNIGQFSGFVWSELEEEKQRTKAKEKLEKCIKEKLIDFCDVLDIPINKNNVKKEELIVGVLDFLVCPKATRDVVLADSEKKTKKRKKSIPKIMTSAESSDVTAKRRRETKKTGKKQDQPSETDEEDVVSEGTNDSHGEDDATPEKENDKNKDTETEDEKDKKSTNKKSSSEKTKKEKPRSEEEKSLKSSTKSGQKLSKKVERSSSSSSKKQKVDKDDSSKEKNKKQTSKQGKARKKGKSEPTRKEMHVVVAKILKEVDFNTATLSDILQNLGNHFGVDLMHRKAEVKDIITDAINEMSDYDEKDENTEDESDKDIDSQNITD